MKNFILGAVQKSRTALSILALLFIMGIYAMITLPKATEPSVTFPGVGVSVVYEGVSPQDSERLLAKPLEAALRPIEGVDFIEVPQQLDIPLFKLYLIKNGIWKRPFMMLGSK